MFSALPHWYCHHKHPNPFFRHYKKVMTYFGDLNWTIISKTFSFSNLVSIRFVDMVYKIHQNHVIIQWYDKCLPRYFQGSQLFMSYLLSKLSKHSPCWHKFKLLLYNPVVSYCSNFVITRITYLELTKLGWSYNGGNKYLAN